MSKCNNCLSKNVCRWYENGTGKNLCCADDFPCPEQKDKDSFIKLPCDVVEVKHGYWYFVEYEFFSCSECGNSYYNGCYSALEAESRLREGLCNNYCSHCGAKMDKKILEGTKNG
jgi:hypothetical protein